MAVLSFIFDPDLVHPRIESNTIVFRNRSQKAFWALLRWEHSSDALTFVIVNALNVENDDLLNQVSSRLSETGESLAIIVTRASPTLEMLFKTYALFKDQVPRKTLLILSHADLKAMVDLKASGRDPSAYIQTIYRGFRDSVR